MSFVEPHQKSLPEKQRIHNTDHKVAEGIWQELLRDGEPAFGGVAPQ
jgi:hypothetical protein